MITLGLHKRLTQIENFEPSTFKEPLFSTNDAGPITPTCAVKDYKKPNWTYEEAFTIKPLTHQDIAQKYFIDVATGLGS